jgi:positive regulator of sigma E activity
MARRTEEYNLKAVNPSLASQWHPTKNDTLRSSDVTPMSNKKVWWICGKGHEWEASVISRSKGTGCPYCCGHRACNDNCLNTKKPQIAAQWHPTKNGSLTPGDVMPMSNKKVWWKCAEGHEWTTEIANRSKGQGCPDCGRTRVSKEYNLEVANKNVAAQWHPTKNGTLSPKDVTPGSTKKVWWICDKGHEYQARVYNRSKGRGCPYCAGRSVCTDNCLQTINPSLAAQWHPKKNDNLSPKDVTPHSNKKVWWVCNNGHEWKALINSRSIGTGCPGCAGRNQ